MHYCVSDVLKTNIVTLEELSQHLRMDDEERGRLERIMKRHPMSITRYYLSLIDPDNPNDALRKIVVPSVEEETVTGTLDTSGEKESTKAVGLQHKYGQTALVLTTHRCPAYCRYCFRRRLVGLTEREIVRNIDDSVAYVREHEEITNVLLSGGDPLSLETHIIEHYLRSFLAIPHLRYIRIGSRIPLCFPSASTAMRRSCPFSNPTQRLTSACTSSRILITPTSGRPSRNGRWTHFSLQRAHA
jgi:KamA family protein